MENIAFSLHMTRHETTIGIKYLCTMAKRQNVLEKEHVLFVEPVLMSTVSPTRPELHSDRVPRSFTHSPIGMLK